MGPAALADYAQRTYGTTMSETDAGRWRNDLIKTVYPEIGRYLAEQDMMALAHNLGADLANCWHTLQFYDEHGNAVRDGAVTGFIRRILRGERQSDSGKPYAETQIRRVWERLQHLCRRADVMPLLNGHGSSDKAQTLFARAACTITGRLRCGCSYTQALNTPFQGLAADGAKLALFDLMRRGYCVAAFIHDEIIIEVPADDDLDAHARELVNIMVRSMQRVCPDVSIACGPVVAMTRWSEDAVVTRDEQGRLKAWSPRDSPIH